MNKLIVQVHPDRLPMDAGSLIRELRSLGERPEVLSKPVVKRSAQSGGYINIEYRTKDIKHLWEAIQTRMLLKHDKAAAIKRALIVVATGESGWSDYLLLHHYNPREKIDRLDMRSGSKADQLLTVIKNALAAIREPRFYESERGFQGELLSELRARMSDLSVPGDAIVEQEYQKTIPNHGLKIRPDLIIHIPTAQGGDRKVGNFVAIELKLNARQSGADAAFSNLNLMMDKLAYPLGIFVNIAAMETYAAKYSGGFSHRLHFFAVNLGSHGVTVRHDYFRDDLLVTEQSS
jgi:hypothetical protein